MSKTWKKRLIIAGSVIGVCLIIGLVIVFNPSFQKSLLVSQLENHFDEVSLDSSAFGPFSGEIKGLHVATDDYSISLDSVTAKYSPWRILLLHVYIEACDVAGLEVDVKQWPEKEIDEAEEEAREGFPGLLALSKLGIKLSLNDFTLDAKAKVPDFEMEVAIKGGGLAPEETGNFQLEHLKVARPGQEDLKRVSAIGDIAVDEIASGAIGKLGWDINVTAEGTIFDTEPKLSIGGSLSSGEERENDKGDEIPAIESLLLTLKEVLETPSNSDLFQLNAQYDGSTSEFAGDFQVNADNETLTPFAIALELPIFRGTGDGKLEWNLDTMTGESTMTMDVSLSDIERMSSVLASIGDLKVKEKHHITATLDQLSVESFALEVTRADGRKVVDLATSRPLIFKRIEEDNKLGDFEKPWLSLAVGIPLEWFDPVLGGFELEGANVEGDLNFAGSPFDEMSITVSEPLEVNGATLYRAKEKLLGDISMRMTPEAKVSPKHSTFALSKVSISTQKQDLVKGDFKAGLDLSENEGFAATADGTVEFFVRGLVGKALERSESAKGAVALDAAARNKIKIMSDKLGPSSLKATFNVTAKPEVVTAETFEMVIAQTDKPPLMEASLSDPVSAKFSGGEIAFSGLDNDWFSAVISGLPVSVVAVFVDAFDLSGDTIHGKLKMGAGESQGSFVLSFQEPLTVGQVNLAMDEQALLQAVDVSVLPSVLYKENQLNLKLDAFSAKSEDGTLAAGNLTADAAIDELSIKEINFTLDGQSTLNAVLTQPVTAPYVKSSLPEAVNGVLKLAGKTDLKSVDLDRLEASLSTGEANEILHFGTTKPLQVSSFALTDLETILNQVDLQATNSLKAFPLWLPLAFVETSPASVTAGTLNGTTELTVGEGSASIIGKDVFQLQKLNVSLSDKPAIKQVSVALMPSLKLDSTLATIEAKDIQVSMGGSKAQPVKGAFSSEVEWLEPMPVKTLNVELAGDIKPWFDQPIVPDNGVSGGQFSFATTIKEERTGTIEGKLNNLAFYGDKPLLKLASLDGTVQMDLDSGQYKGNVPVLIETERGVSDFNTTFQYEIKDTRDQLAVDIKSKLVRLADLEKIIKHFLTARKPAPKVVENRGIMTDTEASSREKKPMYEQDNASEIARLKEKDNAKVVEEPIWETPPEEIDFSKLSADTSPPKVDAFDESPFWLMLPADSTVDFAIEDVRYTDFLSLTAVAGQTKVNAGHIGLDSFTASFREASIKAKAGLEWRPENGNKPYDLDADFHVKQFNLSEFFGALVPGDKPRVEGLFRMTATADGDFPNLESARNYVKFLVDLESKSGVFRAIPPGSELAQGSSTIAATAGEVLSWIPTGGVGLGALSRLVSYMREIPYKLVHIRVTREADLNVKVEKMEVRSEEMLIIGRGGILYEEGVDILQQKLDLTTEMDAVGEMAAILSGLGLLKDERAENGYWHGFDFRIWGTLEEPKSNFDQIVTQASSGALTRNITNPFHGIMGNIKHQGEKIQVPDDDDEQDPEDVN
ncbi:hypothetical protein [Rubellicoccus peritrichatus]|uniref:AsmA-like C-terminal domain-containing protein n=1 Tax=Rubellicoccus peritrichatus TaxID=3080537 RepID=A0AAQ3L4U5_9BACT|nr:hypothetical protein [Puniceicoccus sp. CR14]WOO39389.1 hypothetical protein RZN69_12260 [Puniceicoccus sp. CR14]